MGDKRVKDFWLDWDIKNPKIDTTEAMLKELSENDRTKTRKKK